MSDFIVHEVATPLQLDLESDFGGPFAENDDIYREYRRVLRYYYRIAWDFHRCSYCKEGISPGDDYEGCVEVEKKIGKKSRLIVTKRHYPICPWELREMEEEIHRDWEREDQEKRDSEREAA